MTSMNVLVSAIAFGIVAILVLATAAFSRWLDRSADARILRSLREAPERARIVVLGCTPELRSGAANRYFVARAASAAAAYHHETGRRILCSGRVGRDGQDEASALASILESAGVPRSAIDLDCHAERTIDSIDFLARRHAEEPILLVTQAFHMPRALFLARRRGLEAWGLLAKGPAPSLRGRLRERLARTRALVEVFRFSSG